MVSNLAKDLPVCQRHTLELGANVLLAALCCNARRKHSTWTDLDRQIANEADAVASKPCAKRRPAQNSERITGSSQSFKSCIAHVIYCDNDGTA